MTSYKWTVLIFDYEKGNTFERFDTKEELMFFLEEEQTENKRVLQDYVIFPPEAKEIKFTDIALHGVNKMFLPKN